MNLYSTLLKEINGLNIQEPLAIAKYLYIRTGQLFDYHPLYPVESEQNQEKIYNQTINIENVTTQYIVCSSWAKMYNDLLTRFGIGTRLIREGEHARVVFQIDKDLYFADLTLGVIDFANTKIGLPTQNFSGNMVKINEVDEKVSYPSMTFQKIEEWKEMVHTKNECINYTTYFEEIKKLLQHYQLIGVMSRQKLVRLLLEQLTNNSCTFRVKHQFFYNLSEERRKHIYQYQEQGTDTQYLVGEKGIRRIEMEELEDIANNYQHSSNRLHLNIRK